MSEPSAGQLYLGIDPGLDGAVAVLNCRGEVVKLVDTPVGLVGEKRDYLIADMAKVIHSVTMFALHVFAAVELVHSMPEQGVVSSFTFGKGYGVWQGILAAFAIPFDLVTPQRWKKSLLDGMPKGKDSSRIRAQQLWPMTELHLKKHHGRADALLIAEWRRRQ